MKARSTSKDICAKGIQMGWELCPAEVGPALRLDYRGQWRGEWLRSAMEAITGPGGHRLIFAVCHDGGRLSLIGHCVHPELFRHPDEHVVFLRRNA